MIDKILMAEQIRIEGDMQDKHLESYLEKLNKAIEGNRFDETPEGILLVKLGFLEFRNKIAQYFDIELRGKNQQTKNFIKLLSDSPDELALISLKVIISCIGGKGVAMATVSETITKRLIELHFFNRLKEDNPKLLSYLGQEYKRASRRRKEQLIKKHIDKLYKIDFESNMSDRKLAILTGATIVDLFIKSGANIVEKKTLNKSYKTIDKLYMTKAAVNILIDHSDKDIIIKNTNMIPMIVPPKDWISNNEGGYYIHKLELVKVKSNRHRQYIKDNHNGMKEIFNKINKLQKVSYKVNNEMLDLITHVFFNNMIDPSSPKTLPRCYGDLPSSETYKAIDLIEESPGFPEVEGDKEALEKWGRWNKKRESVQIDLDGDSSRRLDLINAVNVAKRMKDYNNLYFVFQFDYRGRVYYNNQFFNPQSKGYVKSMLEFSKGRKLDDTGIKWLKIHTANVAGEDKELLEDRIKWFNEHENEIIKVGKKPLENLKYWVDTDSPFEFVAACMSYIKYLNNEEVYLPIQLDATNSGIQFYSGLVMDEEGAATVNVVNKYIDNKIVRADIYQDVANLVNKKINMGDYIKGIKYKDSEDKEHFKLTWTEANSLKGKITRTICKKNTMTVAYSVTSRGMMDQNWVTMKEAKLKGKEFWEGEDWVVNKVLTDLNERSIYESIPGAKMGQEYLKEVASKLTDTATWYSPLYNFPIFQPSFKMDEQRVYTPMGRLNLRVSNEMELDKRKQLSSIAANFIHSLDSSLLLYCVDNAIDDIGVIHDCFLVHPNDAENVRTNYKEGYIKIMKTKPLETFQKGLNLNEKDYVKIPYVGTLNLEDILEAEYILS